MNPLRGCKILEMGSGKVGNLLARCSDRDAEREKNLEDIRPQTDRNTSENLEVD